MPENRIQKFYDDLIGKRFSRRAFLKGAGVAGGALAAGSIFGRDDLKALEVAEEAVNKEGVWVASCCNMCGGQSGINVNVIDGVARKIEPNDDNPFNYCNVSADFESERGRGARLCPKGNAGLMSLYDPDRIKTPMRRVGERGSGKWQPISWDEAIDLVASKLRETRERYGPEALVWIAEDHSFTHIQQDFCDLYGTPNFNIHSNLCDVARKRNFSLVMGDERPLGDFQNTKYILIFGWNPLAAMKWIHLPAIINRGREKGAKLVVVDPVFSQTAVKADEWVPIRPGTDGSLALAMGNVIVKEKLYDRQFIDDWTVGFDKYAAFVKNKTPRWAEKITGVPAKSIERLAKELATTKPAVVDIWSGPGHHTNSTQGGRAVAMLPALLGQYDKPGALLIPERKGNKHRKLNFDKPKAERLDGRDTKYPFSHKSGVEVELRDALISGNPYQAKAGVVVFRNPVMSIPNSKKNIEAFKKLEFLAVIDVLMSETAELADVVIPGSNYLERYDLTGNWTNYSVVSLRQPVVKSWVGGMSEAEFVMALGQRLGLKDKDGKGFDMSYEDYLSDELKNGIGITLAELKALPGAVWVSGRTSYEKYKNEVKIPEGATVDETTGIAKDKDGKPIGIRVGEKILKGFATPSRKIEFYSEQMEKKKIAPLPEYTRPEDAPTKDYPLYLVAWKQAEHTHGRTFNNAYLMELKPTNPLYINSITGRKLGLKDGDEVWIESPYAKAKASIHLTERIHPEVVGLHHGYGHWALGSIAKGKGTDDGQFMPGKAEKICGQGVTKEVGVKVYKA